MRWFLLVCVLYSMLLPMRTAHAADFSIESYAGSDGRFAHVIRMTGEIFAADVYRFRQLVFDNPTISAVVLDTSPGGMVDPALEMGRLMRDRGLATVATGSCHSACALMWLGGERLATIGDDVVGFHAAWYGDGDVSSTGNAKVGAYLSRLGYEDNIILLATQAAPEDMQIINYGFARLINLKMDLLDTPEMMADLLPRHDEIIGDNLVPPAEDDGNATVAEVQLWVEARSTRDIVLVERYLRTYPEGLFFKEAVNLYQELHAENLQIAEQWYFAGFAGVDFWGGDLTEKGIEVASIEECAGACLTNTSCKIFTYNEKANKCFLKSDFDIVVRDGGAVSGLIFKSDAPGEPPATPRIKLHFITERGVSFTGIRMPFWQPAGNINTINSCLRFCHQSDGCSYVTFNNRNRQKCKVWRHTVTGTRSERGATAFRKSSEVISPTTEIIALDGTLAR